MKILGIDHSKRAGFALFEDRELIGTWQYLILSKEENFALYEWYCCIESTLRSEKPDVVCMEKPQDMTNAKTARFMTGLYMIQKMLCVKHDIKIVETHPLTLKKNITGDGRAEKKQVAIVLHEKYGIEYEKLEEYEYFKEKKRFGQVKKVHYDKSDATALCIEYLCKNGYF